LLAKLKQGAAAPGDDATLPTIEAARDFARKETARIESDVVPLLRKLAVV